MRCAANRWWTSPCAQIVDKLKTLTLLEAAELVKEIETTFGVDAR